MWLLTHLKRNNFIPFSKEYKDDAFSSFYKLPASQTCTTNHRQSFTQAIYKENRYLIFYTRVDRFIHSKISSQDLLRHNKLFTTIQYANFLSRQYAVSMPYFRPIIGCEYKTRSVQPIVYKPNISFLSPLSSGINK